MRLRVLPWPALLGSAALLAAGPVRGAPAGRDPEAAFVSADVRFGLALYAQLLRESGAKNIVVSPVSVASVLAMTGNGARGETRRAMEAALGLTGLAAEEIDRGQASLRGSWEGADPQVEVAVAHSLWLRQGFRIRSDYLARAKESYGAEVTALDFDDPGSPGVVNTWVSRETRGKIEEMVREFDPATVLLLLNAVYFKGRWNTPFAADRTAEGLFTLAGGGQKKCPLMSRFGDFRYFEGEGFQAVSLPYGNGRVSLYVFLPREEAGLEAFHRDLNVRNWERWMDGFSTREGKIVLPRFRMRFEADLNRALHELGMGIAFDPRRADFSGIAATPPPLYIYQVRHKTMMDVNEEGTEAAAATSVEMRVTSVSPTPPFEMIVDHPFFCAIRDNQTGSLLFLGSIGDPEAAPEETAPGRQSP